MPSLADGEFYFATDAATLFVGFGGGNLQVQIMGMQISDPSTGTNIAGVQAKGVQGTFMLCVQDAKDTGRTRIVLSSTKVAVVTAEALLTLTQKKGAAATTTGASYTVTAGKTLRIQSIFLGMVDSTVAGVMDVAIRVREGATGGAAVSATSDIIAQAEASNQAVTALQSGQAIVDYPDGLEVAGGQQIGVSLVANAVDGVATVHIVGFEY